MLARPLASLLRLLPLGSRIVARLSREQRRPGAPRVPAAGRTLAGVAITPDTAVTVPAVWACLRYLSQTVAVLPWHVMRDGAAGAEVQDRHPIDWLLWKRPSEEWSSFQLRETLTHWALRWGNGYAEIEPDQVDRPFALWPLHPERVLVCRATEPGVAAYGDALPVGALFYEVHNDDGSRTVLAARRVFHVRGFGESVVGVNVIDYAAQSIGWARAAQLFGASFFGNGMNVSGILVNKAPLKTKEGQERQRAELENLYKGPRNANKVAVVDNDAEWKPVAIDPQKSQMLETHQHLVEEVCRWFGVPPHKVMHLLRATFSNIEHQAIEVVVDSVTPWVKRFEDEADWKLFGRNRQGLYTKMNMNALMRGDSKSRGEFYRVMFNTGAYSPNRILELEGENTLGPDGDKRFVPVNMTTLERAGTEPPAPAQADNPPDNQDANPAELAAQNAIAALADRLEAEVVDA